MTWSSIAATKKDFFTEGRKGRKETRKLGDLCDLSALADPQGRRAKRV